MNSFGVPRSFVSFFAAAILALTAVSVSAQQNWRWANSLPASEQWKDVAYGNGVYVAVGLDATIATSPDAITWTIRRMSTANPTLNGVAFANGLFVAVGMGTSDSIGAGLIMTSTNGIDWTINSTVAATYSAQYSEVLYGGGTWVVSGSGSNILTSTDGLNWTSRSFPSGVIPGTGSYGAGKFVLSASGNTVITSPDGITWTRTAVAGAIGASSPYLPDVTFGGGKFVAVGRDSNFVGVAYTSSDGTTWTQVPTIANAGGNTGFLSVVTDGTKFVAAGGAGVFSSADGTSWTKQTSALPSSARQLGPQAENVSAASFANGQFFVLGIYGSITTSADGTTWTRRSTGTVNDLGAAIHDGSKFIASGSGGTILTSADGTTWTSVTTGSTADFHKLAYNGTRYVAAGFTGILQSTNLTSWTAISGTTSDRYTGLAYGNNTFVAAYSATTLGTRTSADGITWSAANNTTGTGGSTNGIVFGSGVFVIITGGGGGTTKILSSTDGVAWTDRSPSGLTATSFDSLAAGGGRFVALTFDRRSVTSADGITWTINTLPASPAPTLSGVQYVGTQFVARSSGYGASSYVSPDGVTWTLLANSTVPNIGPGVIVANGNAVVGVGSSGSILRGDIAGYTPPTPTILSATVGAGATVQWQRSGTSISGATSASYTLADVQPADAGLYSAIVTSGSAVTSQSFVVGVTSTLKVLGSGEELLPANIPHPNGNTFDQVLLKGVAATITADAGQATRLSYIDLTNDIVQVEFSGAGTLSIVLDDPSGPAAPVNYTQAVNYMKGHAGIVITGANETTNVGVFSVGRATAFDPTGAFNILLATGSTNNPANNGSPLFVGRSGTTYDGFADLAFIAISSTNGKFGGLRTANASYFATKGLTGIYAPGVQFTGPVFVGDINASGSATPVFMIGSSSDTRITGGDLLQGNSANVSVAGLTQLKFTDGTTSAGTLLTAQTNKAVLMQGSTNVTSQVVVNPTTGGTSSGTGKELTFFAGTNPPYANGAKKTITASSTSLQFDSTTLTNPVPLTTLSAPFTGYTFTDSATGIAWEVIFNNGALHEINLMSGATFRGQWQ